MEESDLARIDIAKKEMNRNSIDLLILRLSENVLLLDGYWPLSGFSTLFFPLEKEPVLVIPEGELKYAEEGWAKDIRTFGWGKVYDGNPYANFNSIFKGIRDEIGGKRNLNIGFEGDFEFIAPSHMAGEVIVPSGSTTHIIKKNFNGCTFTDATGLLNSIRGQKTEREIEKLKIANEIACFGLEAFFANTVEGIKEADLESRIFGAIHTKGLGYKNVKSVHCWPHVMSGLRTCNSYKPFLISEDRKLEKGDLVLLELGTVADGYWSDLTRTRVAGKPGKKQIEIFELVKQAKENVFKNVREGVTESEADSFARKTINDAGYSDEYFIHHTGHGLGFRYHEPIPFLHPHASDVLKSGMVTSLEPGIYIEGFGGVRIEDDILIKKDKAENLTGYPIDLY